MSEGEDPATREPTTTTPDVAATLPDGRLVGTDDKAANRKTIARVRSARHQQITVDQLIVAHCVRCDDLQVANARFDDCDTCGNKVAWQMPFLDFEARYGVPEKVKDFARSVAATVRTYAPRLAEALIEDGDYQRAAEVLNAAAEMLRVAELA